MTSGIKKYQWIEVDIARNRGDQRPESHRVLDTAAIRLLNEIRTEREWEDRRKLILGNNKIYSNLKEIIGLAHANKISLAVFKPAEMLEFVAEDAEPEWPQEKLAAILNDLKQGNLFEDQNLEDFSNAKAPMQIFLPLQGRRRRRKQADD